MSCCKDCKHWIEVPMQRAHRIKDRDSWGNCDIADGDEGGPYRPGLAFAEGMARESVGMLITHRDFGCVQWEGK